MCVAAISALGRPRQEDGEFEDSLGYTARHYLRTKIIDKNKKQSHREKPKGQQGRASVQTKMGVNNPEIYCLPDTVLSLMCVYTHIHTCVNIPHAFPSHVSRTLFRGLTGVLYFYRHKTGIHEKNINFGHHPELAHWRTGSMLISDGMNSEYSPMAKAHSVRLPRDGIFMSHKDKESPYPNGSDLLEKEWDK